MLVACGTYYESEIYLRGGICLRSETGLPDCVTIDAYYQGRIFNCINVSPGPVIEGFTITHGDATSDPGDSGGGIDIRGSSPRIRNCSFSLNGASVGGAARCYLGSPEFTDCVFWGNLASDQGGVAYMISSTPVFERCAFASNTSHDGGGIVFYCETATITACDFKNNSAERYGGALQLGDCQASITGCTFTGNSCDQYGGAIFSSGAPHIAECFFGDNQAVFGAALYVSGGFLGDPLLTGCTLYANRGYAIEVVGSDTKISLENTIIAASIGGSALICQYDPTVTCLCCDIHGNSGGDWMYCISDQYGVNGNISEAPLFCDPTGGDFRLDCGSPCAQGGGCGQIGAYGVGCGASAAEPTTWGQIKAEFGESAITE